METKSMKKSHDTGNDVTRRDFVTATALGVGATALAGIGATQARAAELPSRWDRAADVVIVGAGATGIPAAIEAAENGASVILIEQNYDIGGHAIQSGAAMPFGGGTSLQKKYGIEDSPERYFRDLVGNPDYRYNDRDLVRTFAEWSAPTFEWLVAHGVVFPDRAPTGNPVKRSQNPVWTGGVNAMSPTGADGTALMRPLEAAARKAGVQILLEHSLTGVAREAAFSGMVRGIMATNDGKTVTIQARKGVILGTGGHTSNVNFRRMFDPRVTEEYQVVGEPYSRQTGDGEIAALQVGAALWGTGNQTLERGIAMLKPGSIGTQYGYPSPRGGHPIPGLPASALFPRMKATGLDVRDFQDVIHVNQVGMRVVNEAATGFAWVNPCMALNGGTGNGGGPIWAIFDADAARRENWMCEPPFVNPDGWFFSGQSLAELAARIVNQYQKAPMPAAALQAAVARYNSFVDSGRDADFAKPSPRYKIQTPPFYAAWSTPCAHDCLSGLRINTKSQVIDLSGQVIPGLYCGGESAGGFSLHGLARCIVQGRIAGRDAAMSR
jgi:FAD binding domain